MAAHAPPPVALPPTLKEISVLAWIEDHFGKVLFVKQAAGKRLWTLPGGKVKSKESLVAALKREIREEIGLPVTRLQLLEIYDRPEKSAVSFLFRVLLKSGPFKLKESEIEEVEFRETLPLRATPSARHFWFLQRTREVPTFGRRT